MAERIQLFDWSRTPLGPLADWPLSLKVAASLVLKARLPMCLAWGESLISLYNDAYSPLLGSHGDALGRSFPELWAGAGPSLKHIVARTWAGETGEVEDFPIVLERRGRSEHTWWRFSSSPVTDETGQVRGMLWIAHETTREVEALRALPTRPEHLTQLFDQAPGFMLYLSGPNHVYEMGKDAEQVMPGRVRAGRSVRDAYPELAGQGVFEALDEVYRSGTPRVETARKIVLTDAAGEHEVYLTQIYQPVRGDDGSVIGIFIVGHDVTDAVKAEVALQEREARLRIALEAGRMAVFEVDLVAGVLPSSPELNRILGLPPDASPSLEEVRAHYYPGERERLRRMTREAWERGEAFFEGEYRHIRADNGEVRWLLIRSINSFAEDGAQLRTFGVLMDVTERKEAEERSKLLALEVDHRANNLLATVQSVVTLTRAQDVAGFRESALGRIDALAHAHRLLAEGRWTAASLARVVEEELRPFMAGHRVVIAGPDGNLAPAVAQGVAIALHELTTNAVKHGALSTPEGRIEVTWTTPDKDGCAQLTWTEHGGPLTAPPTRGGFGMNLLQRALGGALGGAVELEWRPEGLRCRLKAPVL